MTTFRQARLDFFLIFDKMLTNVRNCNIEPSYGSDHSLVVLEIVFNPFVVKKGLYKFNNSLLYDQKYICNLIIIHVKL